MQIRVSGLHATPSDERPELIDRLARLPDGTLDRFRRRIEDVAVHVRPDGGSSQPAAHARVSVRRRHGGVLVAGALGKDPETATRRALNRARRRLRKDHERRVALRA